MPPYPLPLILSQHNISNVSALNIRWPRYWSFIFSTSPSNEYSGLISFRIDWFDLHEYSGLISFRTDWFELFAVQGTVRSVLQHHSLKASILQCSAFFMIHILRTYMTTRKTVAFIHIQSFACKVMSLLFNTLSRFVIAFLPRSERPLISWLQSPCSDFAYLEYNICHCFHFPPTYLP